MPGTFIAFVIWVILGCAFVVLGIYAFLSKNAAAFSFWANAAMFPVKDIKAYNRDMGKLWIVFGLIFIILGLPFLTKGQNSPYLIFSIFGVMAEAIGAMAVYVTVIEKRHRKK